MLLQWRNIAQLPISARRWRHISKGEHMDLKGETIIAAPRAAVWAALNDPAVLARCIDGVEKLEATADNRFEGKLNAKVGPVRATFTGFVTLENIDAPNGYTLVGEGKGGVAGFAKGAADVTLTDADGGTHLAYHAKSQVGGKLAQLGARLIEGTAKAYAESFFAKLKAELEQPAQDAAPPAPSPAAEPAPRAGLSPLVVGSAVALLAAILVAAVLLWV
jgi:uncharacterized protein